MATRNSVGPAADNAEVVAPKPFAVAKVEQEEARQSLIDKMKDHFAGEKRVRVKVRNDGDVFVQINGYSFLVAANVPVEVPESVAWHLENAGYI